MKDRNQLRHNPCHFVDVLPTVVDLAGGSAPVSGRSLAPALQKNGAAPHDFLYFNHNNNRALRKGDWKLISTGQNGPWELYNLATDRCEQRDLASSEPAWVQKLAAEWTALDTGYVKARESSPPSDKVLMSKDSA